MLFNALNVWKWGFVKSKSKSEIRLKSEFSHPYHKEFSVKQSVKAPSKQSPFFVPGIINATTVQVISNASGYLWPCITKPTKSRMAQFCVMARNRWSGSAWVIFRFWYILKEQSFFYIILKFGSIKRIISRGFCCFSRPIFLRSDGSCDHNTCPIISL